MRDAPFREVAAEFLAQRSLYSDDRRSMPSQMRILGRTFNDMRLSQITVTEVRAFMAARLAEGIARPTLNRHRAALSALYTWAQEAGVYSGPNPARALRKFRENPSRERYLSGEEASRLVIAAASHLRPVIICALHTGARLNELLRLRWQDCDLEARTVTLGAHGSKNGRARTVPMDEACRQMLLGLRRGRPEQTVFAFNDEPIRWVKTSWNSAVRRAGIPKTRWSDLRRTFGSWYVLNGGDLVRLQRYLGHSDPRQTLVYARLSRDFENDGVRFFGPPAKRLQDKPSEGVDR